MLAMLLYGCVLASPLIALGLVDLCDTLRCRRQARRRGLSRSQSDLRLEQLLAALEAQFLVAPHLGLDEVRRQLDAGVAAQHGRALGARLEERLRQLETLELAALSGRSLRP